VKAFVNMIGIFPIGTLLKLDTDEVGLVMHQTGDLMRPRVLLLTTFDGSEKESGQEVSLLETAGGKYKRTVVGTINPYAAKINVKKYLISAVARLPAAPERAILGTGPNPFLI
jgi:hypothetical protein